MRHAEPVAPALPRVLSASRALGQTPPSVRDMPVSAGRLSESYPMAGSRPTLLQAAGSVAEKSRRGVGAAPLRTRFTRAGEASAHGSCRPHLTARRRNPGRQRPTAPFPANSEGLGKVDDAGFRCSRSLSRRHRSGDNLRSSLVHHRPPLPGDVAGQRPPGHVAGIQLVTLRGEHVAALKAETSPWAG